MRKIYFLLVMMIPAAVSVFGIDFHDGGDSGKIIIYRPTRIIGCATQTTLYINQHIVIKMGMDEYVELEVDPGEYLISAKNGMDYSHGDTMDACLVDVKAGSISVLKTWPGFFYPNISDDTEYINVDYDLDMSSYDEILYCEEIRRD